MNNRKWIGVDLDGTLAEVGSNNLIGIGNPIPAMWSRVNAWLNDGKYDVKIFTARAGDNNEENKIRKWLSINQLPTLEITNVKDKYMVEIWDDKAVRIERNSGKVCQGCGTAEREQSSLSSLRGINNNHKFHIQTDC